MGQKSDFDQYHLYIIKKGSNIQKRVEKTNTQFEGHVSNSICT